MVAVALESLQNLPRMPASDVKKLGWRGVMKSIARSGKVVVTHHDEPEAVILSADEYTAIVSLLQAAGDKDRVMLDALRHQYDERLKALDQPGAGDTLRTLLRAPLDLGGKVLAGHDD